MIDCDTGQHLEQRKIQGMQVICFPGTTEPVVFFDYGLTVAQHQQASGGGQPRVDVIERFVQTGQIDVLSFRFRRIPLFLIKIKCLLRKKRNAKVHHTPDGSNTGQVKGS